MTTLQFSVALGLPVLLIVAGMFFNWSAANTLRSDLNMFRTEQDRKFDAVNGRLDVLKDYMNMRFDEIKEAGHKDTLVLLNEMTVLHERVAIVETKQK